MYLSSEYYLENGGFESENSEEQGSKLTVINPQEDMTYTCRVMQNDDKTDSSDNFVTLNVYGA